MLDNTEKNVPAAEPAAREAPQPTRRIREMSKEEKAAYNRAAKERAKEKKKNASGGGAAKASNTPADFSPPPGADEPFAEKPQAAKRRKSSGSDKAGSIQKMSQFIGAFHMILATKIGPEMMLQEQEAVALATSVTELLDQYDYSLDPKTAALVGVVTVAGGIYIPRFMAVGARVAQERARAAQAKPAAASQGQQPGVPPSPPAPPAPPAPPQSEMYGAPETTEEPNRQD